MKNIFVTVINCIDGRAQKPVMEFAKRKFGVDYVDLITEPGPDKALSEDRDLNIIDSIKRRVLVSIEKHKSKIVIIAGHYDCAANPIQKEEHYKQIKEAAQKIRGWKLKVNVYGVWIGSNWEAKLLREE